MVHGRNLCAQRYVSTNNFVFPKSRECVWAVRNTKHRYRYRYTKKRRKIPNPLTRSHTLNPRRPKTHPPPQTHPTHAVTQAVTQTVTQTVTQADTQPLAHAQPRINTSVSVHAHAMKERTRHTRWNNVCVSLPNPTDTHVVIPMRMRSGQLSCEVTKSRATHCSRQIQ